MKKLLGIGQKQTVDPSMYSMESFEPAKVMYHGQDVSFPNRVSSPKYGKRPIKMLTIPPVK